MSSSVVCPWLVPKAPDALLKLVREVGREERFAQRSCLQTDWEPYDVVRAVCSGLVSQGVMNHRLTKPMAMNLYPEGTLLGFLNLFSGVASPRMVRAVRPTVTLTVDRALLRERIASDHELTVLFATYAERAAKSELIGMEALFSLSLPERLRLWFASAFLYVGIDPRESTETHLPMPFDVTRAALGNILYSSRTPLDRLLAQASRDGFLLRSERGRLVRLADLSEAVEWIRTR